MFGIRKMYVAVALMVGMVCFTWGVATLLAYETTKYEVVESAGKIEIREYPELMLASTNMNRNSQGEDGSFMRLFRYISGSNDREQKVAMTTPVFMEEADAESGHMGFVIPTQVAKQRIPQPEEEGVEIRKRSAGRFAVIRFAGRMNKELIEKSEAELREWIDERQLVGEDDIEYAGYDPPWTPGRMRRNEVLIRLKEQDSK